jgi:methionyl-tRNA synthetase
VNAELVNNTTNLISRTVGFLNKRLDSQLGTVPEDEETRSAIKEIKSLVDSVETDYRGLRFGSATQHILAISTLINGYIQTRAPWDLMKAEGTREEARNVLTFAVNAIKVLTVLLKPIIPAYCKKVETMLGVGELAWPDARLSTRYLENHTVGTFEKLADRLEAKTIDALLEASRQSLGVAEKDSPASQIPEFKSEISIEQLMEVDLRVGRIEKAEQVKGSDKLLKLTVNLGRETRTIFAGIARTYEPGMLEGKNAAVAANLKPRKMRFGMSEGMVLAGVGPDGELAICELDPSLAPGSPIQ